MLDEEILLNGNYQLTMTRGRKSSGVTPLLRLEKVGNPQPSGGLEACSAEANE
jgi:hypothetical protein